LSNKEATSSLAEGGFRNTSERLTLDAESDGTMFGEEKQEEKRQKDESWARYTDAHPKGAGNMMNRG